MKTSLKKPLLLSAVAAGMAFAPVTGASAAALVNEGGCDTAGVFASSFSFLECSGVYNKNVLSNNSTSVDTQIAALTALGVDTTDFDFNDYFKIASLSGGNVTSPPAPVMSGITVFGVHFGGGSVLGNKTAFYKFDAGTGTTEIPFATKGSSGFVLYQTGGGDVVPEPATWALMIGGFGLVGFAARRARRRALA